MILEKKPLLSILLCMGFLFILKVGPLPGQTDLLKAYKSGSIHLKPDPDFGKNTDWNALFYHLFCDLAIAPDGSIFIASSRQHKIFKFDSDGNLIKSFGQEGQGPGDFNMPGDLSILDEKLLVVGDNPRWHRISLFDLEGNFKKVLKTSRPPFRPVALRGGKIAYIVHSYRGEGTTDRRQIESIAIRDINSDREVKVSEFTFKMDGIRVGQGTLGFGDSISGGFFIASSKEGNLLVGNSLRPFLDVFSPDGTKISAIPLDMEPIPVTKRLIGEYKKYHIDQFSQESPISKDRTQEMVKQLKKASWDHLFIEILPLYRDVLVDAEGNFIVFRRTDCLGEECPILVQVYSPDGEFIWETEMVEGPFDLAVDPRIKNICFTDQGLIAMVAVKDAADFELRVIKVAHK